MQSNCPEKTAYVSTLKRETGIIFLYDVGFFVLFYRKLRPVKQSPPGDAHFALRENSCCGNRSPVRESGKPDSLF